ncbi:hypothetical protein GQ457_04G022180 [Hibiscus cannabinus]
MLGVALDNESRNVLDAFFLGKVVAKALNERIESTIGEFLSVVGRLQAEQQKQLQDFQVMRLCSYHKPEPIQENSTDDRWKWFKGCLGALYGTFIKVNVALSDRPRYRTRKNEIATNVLGVCTPDMQFIYVLPGWEGSAADGRVLRDAISRRNGLNVPQGCYYLCDAGYTNGEGFLAPYRGQRYHLNDWRQGHQPTTAQEYFNMKHSQARNCIERCFGILKARWTILRGKSFYPVKTQCRIISACCLLHNFIRSEMLVDPFETNSVGLDSSQVEEVNEPEMIVSQALLGLSGETN